MKYLTLSLFASAALCLGLGCSSTSTATLTETDSDGGEEADKTMMGWPYEAYDAKVKEYPEEIQATWPTVWEKCGTASCHKGMLTKAFEYVEPGWDREVFADLVIEMADKPNSGILNSELDAITDFLFYAAEHDWPQEPK